MTAAAAIPHRRGACPALSAPMQTGDGLLARITPTGELDGGQLAVLCGAAYQHGNGIIEITVRGSIQIRGLSETSAPHFRKTVTELGIAGANGVPVIVDPLAALAPPDEANAEIIARDLRRLLSPRRFSGQLAPKVSVVIDGSDGALHLDALAADVRLRAAGAHKGPWMHVGLGGDAASASPIGAVTPIVAAETAARLLAVIAAHGPQARARDVIASAGLEVFRAAVADRLVDAPPLAPRPASEPIGIHPLRTGAVAIGFGLPFGHTDAITLQRLIDLVRDDYAAYQPLAGRVLLVVGIAPGKANALATAAKKLGFITDPNDPRRRVIACAGAPICVSGEIAARALAPQVAKAAGALLGPADVIHVSGCAKGCAHHGAATFAAIGRAGQCDLLIDGAPAGSVAPDALAENIARLARARSAPHG
jgi:precorrin-3B synthase